MKTATIIISIVALMMPATGASLMWAHSHGEKLPLANEANIQTLASINQSQKEIKRLEDFRDNLHILLGNFQNSLFQAEMVPVQTNHILEKRHELEIEIEGYKRLLEQQQRRIRDEQKRESLLIERLSTA